jgi:hypothetical protein
MFKKKASGVVLLFFFVYGLTVFINPGFMGTDEYWTGITRYIPAQEKTLNNMMMIDDVKSPTQIMPLIGLSHLGLQLGIESPWAQYRFVQIFVGLFSTLILGFCLFFFIPPQKHFFVFLAFCFYFAGAFALTRPMYESMSAPWIFLSALSLRHYDSYKKPKWVLLSTLGISIAFALRPQTGICALGLLGFLFVKKDWKALAAASLFGILCFILLGIPDIFYRNGFHSSLKGILFYNVKYGASYAQQPWFFYFPLVFLMMFGPFWFSKKTPKQFLSFWQEHKIFWIYILLLIALHSFFPQKWERFVIPVLGLLILILSDWIEFFWNQGARKRIWLLVAFNMVFWIPSTFFAAQKNIIDMSLFLNSHPQIHEIYRFKKSPQWITEVFIQRKNWKWMEVETLPTIPLSCDSRLVMNFNDFKKENPLMVVEKIFETNIIEKVAYNLNPEKNIRRTPLVLLKSEGCD